MSTEKPRIWPRALWPLGSVFCFVSGRHSPARVLWGRLSGGWRCRTCGRAATTAEELMGLGPGFVHQSQPRGLRDRPRYWEER